MPSCGADVDYAYSIPFEKKSVSSMDIERIETGLIAKDVKADEVIKKLNTIREEFLKEDASEQQIISLEKINFTLTLLGIYKMQIKKNYDLVSYFNEIKDRSWTNEQEQYIRELVTQIDDYNRKARDLMLEFENR